MNGITADLVQEVADYKDQHFSDDDAPKSIDDWFALLELAQEKPVTSPKQNFLEVAAISIAAMEWLETQKR